MPSIDRYRSLNVQNNTKNSSSDSQRRKGRDLIVSNKSCECNIGKMRENTANDGARIFSQLIDWNRNSIQQGSSRTIVKNNSISKPEVSNDGNEKQPGLSERTQKNQHNKLFETNWLNQFNEPFQFVKSN